MKVEKGKFYGVTVLKLIVLVIAFLVSVQWMVISFKWLNVAVVEQIIIATSNPFLSLFIGLLITALVQSSSTTTTMIVAIVASGTLSLENAVYMVMGANIGTTITSTMVSLGYVTRKKEFRKAVAAATIHDFFNILTAVILLPLEYYFGLLSNLSIAVASLINPGASLQFSDLNVWFPFLLDIQASIYNFTKGNGLIVLLLSVAILFISLRYISITCRQIFIDQYPSRLETYLFRSSFQSLLLGALITGMVQSSSLISSSIVPVVATNKLSLKKAFPFIMGANIGTTLTALIAAISKSDAALSIALAHMFFNVIGVFIFYPFERIRKMPIKIARNLGKATLKNRSVGFAYMILTFFVIPFFLIYLSRGKVKVKQYTYVEQSEMSYVKAVPVQNGYDASTRLFYKQVNISGEWLGQDSEENRIIIDRQGDSILINQQKFILGKIGDCWEGVDKGGAYSMCISDIQEDYDSNRSLAFDTCYIFLKEYQTSSTHQIFHKLYLDTKNKLIVKHELLDETGRVIGKEELISIIH